MLDNVTAELLFDFLRIFISMLRRSRWTNIMEDVGVEEIVFVAMYSFYFQSGKVHIVAHLSTV